MSEPEEQRQEEIATATKVVWSRGVGYKNDGVDCEVHCLLLDDNGVQWVFKRAGREVTVRLSDTAMEAVFTLWQRALWEAPPASPPSAEDPSKGATGQ